MCFGGCGAMRAGPRELVMPAKNIKKTYSVITMTTGKFRPLN